MYLFSEILLHLQERFSLCFRYHEVEEEVGGHGNGSKEPVDAMRSHKLDHEGVHLGDNEDSKGGYAGDHP